MVTPTGRTNELTSSEIPNFCSTVFRVTGKVAALLLVVKANSCTGELFLQMGYLFVVYQFARLHQ